MSPSEAPIECWRPRWQRSWSQAPGSNSGFACSESDCSESARTAGSPGPDPQISSDLRRRSFASVRCPIVGSGMSAVSTEEPGMFVRNHKPAPSPKLVQENENELSYLDLS